MVRSKDLNQDSDTNMSDNVAYCSVKTKASSTADYVNIEQPMIMTQWLPSPTDS